MRNGVRLTVIGRRDRLPAGIADAIGRAGSGNRARRHPASAHRGRLLRARCDPQRGGQGRTASGDLTRENFSDLITGEAGLRDVDLVIRTSGEQRLSDFLLWESAYAELHFTEKMWPDFGPADLEEALTSFHGRERRFGGLAPEALEPKGEPALSF